MIVYIICAIFVAFAGLFIADSTIEVIVFNKKINTLSLDRYDIWCNNKHTRIVSDSEHRLTTNFREWITLIAFTQYDVVS